MPLIKYTRTSGFAKEPELATMGSACHDLFAAETVWLAPNEIKAVSIGLRMEIPVGYKMNIVSRSGMTLKSGVVVANAPGTIDSDYRGVVKVILHNTNQTTQALIQVGQRIAQMSLEKVVPIDFYEVGELSETERGDGGFGHTGK